MERSIKEIKKIFYIVYSGLQLDVLAYETAFGWVSNELINLPICLGSSRDNLDNQDLITPQRLISRINNTRAPQGPRRIDVPSRLIKQMEKVYESWWNTWTMEKVINYIPDLSCPQVSERKGHVCPAPSALPFSYTERTRP